MAAIDGPGEIRHLWFTVAPHTAELGFVLRDLVLRMYWDGEPYPSVEVPLGDFFCNGNGGRALVDSAAIVVAPTGGMNAYFRMPFASGARITVTNENPGDVAELFYQVDYQLLGDRESPSLLRFHAHWRRENPTTPGRDFTILERQAGAGVYIGTFLSITALERYWWGEGEVKMYIDGDLELPTICGTGTEDYFGGAWAFQDRLSADVEPSVIPFSTAYAGYVTYATRDESRQSGYVTPMAPVHGLYRWHLPDPVHFSTDLRVTVQQIGQAGRELFERSDDVSAVAYWYQMHPFAQYPRFPGREERRPR